MIMKTPSFIFLILIVLGSNACNSRTAQYSDISDFMTEKNIQFDDHKVSVLLGMPMEILVMNDMAIILDGQTDKNFHILSIEDFRYLGSFIRRGKGPGEEVFIYPAFKKYGYDKILYQSEHDLKLASVIMSDNSLDIVILEKIELPKHLSSGGDFTLVNGNIFNSFGFPPASKDYYVLNLKTGKITEWGESPPLTDKNVHRHGWISDRHSKLTTVSIKQNLVASVFTILPILRIYSLEKEELIVELIMSDVSDNVEIMTTGQKLPNGTGLIDYYHSIKSTDDYIYALYAGVSIDDSFKEGEEFYYKEVANELHIWKWDGTPVMKLLLDRPVFAFDVTPDNKKIIATSVVDVEKIFEAMIPWD
jgi:hypothetical protein